MPLKIYTIPVAIAFAISGSALAAQDSGPSGAAPSVAPTSEAAPSGRPPSGESVFDDNWIGIGAGVALSPSYTGSDDYVVSPLPIIQGSIGGINIQPRPAGVAIDLVKDKEGGGGPNFSFGPTIRLRSDRARHIEDSVVEAAGKLDRAVEAGATLGVSFPKLLNPYDSLTVSTDIRWDLAGAHKGMVVEPSIAYSTPLNRGMFASVTLGSAYVSDDFSDYYFSVTPTQNLASGLPLYKADGGFTNARATMLLGVDFDGNALNGGLGAIVIASYSRLLGDAKHTPYTSIRGSADQFMIGVGLGYTF